MIYEYYCEETKEILEKEYSMKDDIPSKIEEKGKTYYRLWGSTIHIPYQWGEGPSFDYGKSPSGKKKFF